MFTLAELRARLEEIDTRRTELATEFRDAEMPEAEDKEWDALVAERSKVETSIKKIEDRSAAVKDAVAGGTDEVRTEDSSKTSTAFHRSNDENIYDLEEIRKNSFGGDDFVERATQAALKGLEKAQLPTTVRGKGADAAKAGLEDMLERDVETGWLAKRMVLTGSKAYERAYGKAMLAGNTHGLTQEEHRAIAIATDASGNFAVPFQLDPTLVHLGAGYVSPIRQLAKVVQLIGKEYQTLTISEIAVYRAAEAATAIDSSPTLAQRVLRVNKVHGFVPFSMEAEEDWPSLRSEVFQLLQEAKDKEEATAFLLGTGVDPQPQGLITGATQTVAAGTGLTVSIADLYKLTEALPIEFENNAVFLGNKPVMNKIRQLGTAAASTSWQDGLQNGNPDRLLGYDVYRASGMANTSTNLNKFLVFGDIRKAFTILDRVGMSVELIPMLFDSSGGGNRSLPTGQRGFYAHWRNNSKVVDPNAIRVLTATT